MKKTRERISVVLFVIVLVLLSVILANVLSRDNPGDNISRDISENSGSAESGNDNQSKDESEFSTGTSSPQTSEDDSSSAEESVPDTSEEKSEPAESWGEPSTDESSEESSGETSEESSTDPDDKTAKKEKPVYIERQPGVKYVAFTFDDGPSVYSKEILDFIEEKGIVVTFFNVGTFLEYESLGKHMTRAVSLGCEVGIHAYTHEYYFHKCSDEIYFSELSKTENLIYKYTGYYPIIMRPPGGSISEKRLRESEYNVIIWNVDSEDWKYKDRSTTDIANKNIQTIVNNIINGVRKSSSPDCIILMHDLYKNSVEAFKIAAVQLMAEGYQFVTVAQLCQLDATTTVGKSYYSPTVIK
jgi:peptidoglycan/xylan/chitin deacetylase (PgdA/CDA1 family)